MKENFNSRPITFKMQKNSSFILPFVQRIAETPVEKHPFYHFEYQNVFPAETYRAIQAHLPPDECYRDYKHGDATLANGRSARLKLDLFPETLISLPKPLRAFWSDVSRQLRSREVEDAFKAKFADVLEQRTGKPVSKIKLHPYPVLFRDISGYKISIHPDSPRKAITTQFYLPADDSQPHLGTIFHEKQPDGKFRQLRALQFLPNSGYAFGVAENSWHSVTVMSSGEKPRNSIMCIYYYDRGPVIEALKWVQRKLGVVRALKPSDAKFEGKVEM